VLELDKIYCMDCLEGIKQIEENSVDAVVTDPPYELGFMGKKWDATGISYNVGLWVGVLRVLKPGGHLLSFGGSRTYHRMACAIEDAGFEIRDMINWIYGSGFPKSLNIGKAIDKLQGNEREVIGELRAGSTAMGQNSGWNEHKNKTVMDLTKGTSDWEGWGTALKPAHEPVVLARKPLSEGTVAENVLRWGVGGLNIDGCRITTKENLNGGAYSKGDYNTDGKVLELGLKRQEGKYQQPLGRFPANLIHDGSPEVVELFPETGQPCGSIKKTTHRDGMFHIGQPGKIYTEEDGNNHSASRFFYCAKSSKSERDMGCDTNDGRYMDESRIVGSPGGTNPRNRGAENKRNNFHPTVKPLTLMEYLIKLVTKENQVVLDPFIGSGTTALSCKRMNRHYIGFELNPEYCKIANKRLTNVPQRLEVFG